MKLANAQSSVNRLTTGLLALTYMAALVVILPLAPSIDAAMGVIGEVRSEYSVYEQLSKYLILLLILAAVRGYTGVHRPIDVITAIMALLFGLALYLGESNMIQDWSQPVFGATLALPLIVLFHRTGNLSSLALILAGMLGLALGGVLDAIADQRLTLDLPIAQLSEEFLEVAGTALVTLSVLLRFLDPLKASASGDKWAVTSLLGSAGLIAAGNSFLHYQYSPGTRLRLLGFGLSVAGFAGLWWANRRLEQSGTALRLPIAGWFYALGFVAFILLPMVFGRSDGVVSLAFWPPVFVALAGLLYRHHSLTH